MHNWWWYGKVYKHPRGLWIGSLKLIFRPSLSRRYTMNEADLEQNYINTRYLTKLALFEKWFVSNYRAPRYVNTRAPMRTATRWGTVCIRALFNPPFSGSQATRCWASLLRGWTADLGTVEQVDLLRLETNLGAKPPRFISCPSTRWASLRSWRLRAGLAMKKVKNFNEVSPQWRGDTAIG